tara:strand:+ start:254 stop:463 length:210 start_codon:yes stop_codon:yes gene_type:complete
MNYYLNNYPKTEFYYLGKCTPTEFIEGRGMKFIKEYLDEFPFLLDEISVIDELNNTTSFYDFFKRFDKK